MHPNMQQHMNSTPDAPTKTNGKSMRYGNGRVHVSENNTIDGRRCLMRKQHAEVVVNAVAVEDVNLAEHDFRSVEDHLASAGTVSMHMHVDNDDNGKDVDYQCHACNP